MPLMPCNIIKTTPPLPLFQCSPPPLSPSYMQLYPLVPFHCVPSRTFRHSWPAAAAAAERGGEAGVPRSPAAAVWRRWGGRGEGPSHILLVLLMLLVTRAARHRAPRHCSFQRIALRTAVLRRPKTLQCLPYGSLLPQWSLQSSHFSA